jgi:nucleotide-binding universal stress UspA family protein
MAVVAGVDDSPLAPEILDRAVEQAAWRDTPLHVVHVFHPPVAYLEFPMDLESIAGAQRSAVWDPLEPLIPEGAVRADLDGYPPDALVAYAHDVDASLLVVGTRGRGDLAALILGSTSHRTLHLGTCDVLVVKPARV